MALVHYLYVGHFVPEDGLVRMENHRPFAKRPISQDAVNRLLKKNLGDTASAGAVPEEWGLSILPDYIVCYAWSPPATLRFAADYAEQERALVVDMGTFSLLAPEQLRQAASVAAAPAGFEVGVRADK